ncbi:MAG: hypothetical protein HFE78_07730, partial [Clostridiales bacterium]|nr:hypothetical protein [Clostridiales bacterium]
ILRENEKAINYFINNFLLVYSYGTDVHFDVYFEPSYLHKITHIEILKHCPLIDCIEMERGTLNLNETKVKKWLDQGWYILVKIDKSQITDCPKAGESWHEVMVYKYEKGRLFFCDNGSSGKFVTDLSCTMNDYINAFNAIEKTSYESPNVLDNVWKQHFWLCKPCEHVYAEIDIKKVIYTLKVYLNIIPYSGLNDADLKSIYFDLHVFVGQKVYGNLIQFTRLFERSQHGPYPARMHPGGVSVLCDHKQLIVRMVKELAKQYDIPMDLIECFEEISIEMQNIRRIVLKYYIYPQNKQLLSRIIKRIQKLKQKERNALLQLLNRLEKHSCSNERP